jgi:hypothetical protein
MNIAQKRAALSAINPTAVSTGESITKRVITDVADRVGVVPSYTLGFFSDMTASFKYEEAKRKGLI